MIRRRQRYAAASLAVLYFVILLSTSSQIGFTRDEGYYFKAARIYAEWFQLLGRRIRGEREVEPFSRDTVEQYWSYNRVHPPFAKSLSALSWLFFNRRLGLANYSLSFRLPYMALASLLMFLVFLFASEVFNERVAVFSVFALCTMPRFFFHCHLACFDVPITTMTFLTIYAFWKSLSQHRWIFPTAFFFGLAIATKHNGYFIIPMLVVYILLLFKFSDSADFYPKRKTDIIYSLIFISLIGMSIFFLSWPWLWHDAFKRILQYFKFQLFHVNYPVFYFGKLLTQPPFPVSYPFVMTLLTIPLVIIFSAILGVVIQFKKEVLTERAESQWKYKPALLCLVGLVFPIAVIAMPQVPIFGGTKHWFPAFPFIALFAGLGLDFLLSQNRRAILTTGFFILLSAPGILGILFSHPHGISYYNCLYGGNRTSMRLGMQTQFWGSSSRQLLDWLNTNVPKDGKVYFDETNDESITVYKIDGMLRMDIEPVQSLTDDWDHALMFYQQDRWDKQLPILEKKTDISSPVTGIFLNGVPLILVYKSGQR